MQTLPKMVDLANIEKDDDECAVSMPMDSISGPRYPWGLRITLDTETLAKLNLDPGDVSVGDTIHIFAFAEVVGVNSSSSSDGGTRCSVDLQITQMASEDEDEENEEMDAAEPKKPRTLRMYS